MELASSIIGIFPWVWDKCAKQVNYIRQLRENLTSLSTSLEKLRELRDTVKKKVENAETNSLFMKRNPQVAGWLRRVETEEREVDQILQAGTQQLEEFSVLTGCFCCCPPKKNCRTGYKLGKQVVKKLASVENLTGEGVFPEVVDRSITGLVQERPTDQQVVGTDPLLEEIWRLVTTTDGQSKIIGLYGMGGVGKTTLLTKLNNEFLKKDRHDFDLVLWVVVSQDLNLMNVQKTIGDSLGLSWKEETNQHTRANDVFNTLSKRKFVLLLDDVWQRVDLQSIGIPPLDASSTTTHGITSKVVFTTRSEAVCGEMDADSKIRVPCLNWDEAWSLFQEKVGHEALNFHPKIPELAKIVAKECGGLPLLLVTIGRTMASKKTPKEWEYAITQLKRSASDFSGMGDKVFSTLKFSYDNLENDKTRNCFLYCSLYPEDYQMEKNKLIDLWIGEGFLTEFDDIEEARNEGHYVIGCLLSACLLESVAGEESKVKMHDVIRDLATWVASDCGKNKGKFLVVQSSNELIKVDEWEKGEKISIIKHRSFIGLEGKPPSCPNLSTLLIQHGTFTISNDFFKYMPMLKVLDMSNNNQNMPTSITSLVELEHLNLSNLGPYEVSFMAGWLRSLVKLKFLDLSYTSCFLKVSPGDIACLTKLKMLDLFNSELTNWEAEGGLSLKELEGLKSLNFLGISINAHALPTLVNSIKLRSCTRRLSVFVDPLASSSLTGLAKLINLKVLFLKGHRKLEELRISCCVAENEDNIITLPTSLEKLTITVPNLNFVWDVIPQPRQFCFINLQRLNIRAVGALVKDLTWLIYAQCLTGLFLSSMGGLEEIISDNGIAQSSTLQAMADQKYLYNTIFSSLEILYLYDLRNLRSICLHPLAFPCLKLISVHGCHNLKKLPFDINSAKNKNNSRTLQIQGGRRWWERLSWDDETIKSTFVPCFKEEKIFG